MGLSLLSTGHRRAGVALLTVAMAIAPATGAGAGAAQVSPTGATTAPATTTPATTPATATPATTTTAPATTTPATATPAGTVPATTTPATTTPATTVPATTTPATTTPAIAPSRTGVLPARRASRHRKISTAAIVGAALAALLILLCAVWAAVRWLAIEPRWTRSLAYSLEEASFRASATWAEFLDWAKIGR